jgi:phosphopantothenoylcysteine decarboxylase/phosphopantothenate--cysteine ligase
MNCVVTAGPTYEPLDEVRRLTNFSTGTLGSELANFLVARGHTVTLLIGYYALFRGEQKAQRVETFSTTADLKSRLQTLAGPPVQAVFHAAAVSDYTFGKIRERSANGELIERKEKKIATRHGTLLAELKPTPKIISELRGWFPRARLIGWKYEVDGDRQTAIAKAVEQIAKYQTNACVANGPAYGDGFGLVTGPEMCEHFADVSALYESLARLIAK